MLEPRLKPCLSILSLLGLAVTLAACGDDGPGGANGTGSVGDCNPQGDQDSDGRTDCEELQGYMISVDVLGFGLDSTNSESRMVTSDPARADTDGDGIDDREEFQERIDPSSGDTDADGLGDFDELRRWRTSPRTVDSDDDATNMTGRNPVIDLWDANELKLVEDPDDPSRMVPGPGATDPTDPDTDGDGISDLEEFDDPIVDPVLADLPSLRLDLTTDPQIRLNYTTTALQGATESVGTTLSRETSSSIARSDSTSTTYSAELTTTIGTEVSAGLPPSASVSAEVSASVGVERGSTTELSRENSRSVGTAQSTERTLSREEGYSVTTGEISVGVQLRNDGDITYRVAGVDFLVRRFDQESRVSEPLAVLTLPDSQSDGFVLQPNGNVELLLQGQDLDAGLVQSFIRQPSALFFEPIQPDLRDENDTNFSFIDQTRGRTALVVVDDGSGEDPLSIRVATNVDRADDGTRAGLPLQRALDEIGVEFTVEQRDGREVLASVEGVLYELREGAAPDLNDPDYGEVGGPGDRSAERFWTLIGSRDDDVTNEFGALNLAQDFTRVRIQNRDQIRLVLVRDSDGDGVYDREEFMYGARDDSIDTDGDGLSDYFEIKVGWLSLGNRVYPSPAIDDYDDDGWTDEQERLAETDPRSPDTDGDGIEDSVDPSPLVAAENMPPIVSGLNVSVLGVVGNGYEVRVTGDVTDQDGTVEVIRIDWGDGSIEDFMTGTIDQTHTYAAIAPQTITVFGIDELGAIGMGETLEFDPNPDGRVFWVRFDGSVVDVDAGRNVVVSGTPSYQTDHRGGANGAADFFNMGDSGSGVLASFGNLGLTGDQTITLWVLFPLVNSERILGTEDGLQFYVRSGSINFGWAERFADGASERGPSVSAPINQGEWYHFAGVKRGNTLELFVNGNSRGTVTETRTLSSSCRFFIGAFMYDDDLCTGTQAAEFNNPPAVYDDLRVYDRALTQGQVAILAGQ